MKHLVRLAAALVLVALGLVVLGWLDPRGTLPYWAGELGGWLGDRPEIVAAAVLGVAVIIGAVIIASSRSRLDQLVDPDEDQTGDRQ